MVTAVGPTIDDMAHLHRSGMSPSKIELLDAWVPTQPWFEGPAPSAKAVRGRYQTGGWLVSSTRYAAVVSATTWPPRRTTTRSERASTLGGRG